ncbi:hypothetical protein [Bacillus swezeyi]|uniref:Uncharacterized protein n=1 Tax=Bacillus swezeyi TaxID=1925020 RepID=A0A5M8RZR0_9BACI|nr:hypothetical protein [Bacillus swezeyi]KAA6452666.1 hypothetical protein DX927_00080 [Bacillus swezeyi]TYS38035.1 hypothetical protein FZC77_00005 [Bacillus swezeyi]
MIKAFFNKLIELIKKVLYGIGGLLLAMGVFLIFCLPAVDGEGDEITIRRAIFGANSIETFEENYGDGLPNLLSDGVNTIRIPRYQEIKIIKTLDEDDMALIEILGGSDDGTQWWVKKSDIERKRSSDRY